MKCSIAMLLSLILAVGCGAPETEVVSVPEPQIQVIGFDGAKKTIPNSELYDAETGQPTVASVLVIDRATNRQMYLKTDELPAESQAEARYILATDDTTVAPR